MYHVSAQGADKRLIKYIIIIIYFSKTIELLYFRGCTSGGVYVPCIYTHAR